MTMSRFWLFMFILMICCLSGCSSRNNELTGEEIYAKIANSTVEISAEGNNIYSLGSGFCIDTAGKIVTNYHVIEGCTSAAVTTANGSSYAVTSILGYSKELDIAILSTSMGNSTPVEIAPSTVSTGETVYALGSSLGLTGTFSQGVVSSATRDVDGMSYIQITTPISSGNSGGPLVNKMGQVVGITSAGFSDGQNLNLAIPIGVLEQVSCNNPLSMKELYCINNKKVVSFALQTNNSPFSYETTNGFNGIDVDIINELAKRLNLDVVFVPISNDDFYMVIRDCYKEIRSGKYELTAGAGHAYSKEMVSFTEPYYDDRVVVYNSASFDEFYNIDQVMKDMLADGTVDELISKYSDELNINIGHVRIGLRTIALDDRVTAENILNEWKNGEATEGSLIQIMDMYGATQGGGQLYLIELGDFVEEINNWCFDKNREVGDTAIIENRYGYSICYISSIE